MNSIPPRSVWQHPRHDPPPPPPSIRPARKSFLGRLKAKMGDLEAETSQAEAKKKQELLSRYTKRREEVLEELVKNPQPRFGGSEYVGPPTSPFGGKYRGLMPTRVDDNMAGWL
ncbi:WW/Rsp5/WWP protein [Mycena kentingensis (nom. inval.)]|nr:WW/Rsp5/WWP protein [Mycena kentingensis (nom. inval.)]